MKKLCLLSGMLAFGAVASINADVTYPGGLKEKHIQRIEQAQYKKIERQAQLARPSMYTMIDPLVKEEYASGHDDENGQWIQDSPAKTIIDWPAVFGVIDSMQGAFDVDAYYTPMNQNSLLWTAVEQGNFLAAKTLLEKYHADPNEARCMGGHEKHEVCHKMSLLRLAQQKKDFTMALLLRQHGANL